MADVLKFQLSAEPSGVDVQTRKLTVAVDGEERPAVEFPAGATDLGTIDVPQDSQVTLTLVDVDDAGNASAPLVVSFQAVDTLPPAQPGGLNVSLVGESEA